MLDRAVLRRLHRLTEHEALTLTLYVATDQNRPSHRRRGYVVQAEAMLKELRSSHGDDGDLATACESALGLVDQLEPRGRTALVVVHPATGVAEVHTIQVDIAPSVHWRRGAFLRPVVEALDEYERFAVVLTGKKRARIFTVYLGEIVERTDLLSATSTRAQTTGTDQWWSQARFQRHHDREVALHAKRVVDALFDLSLKMPFDRLIVAGPTEAAGQVARLLPRRVHGKLLKTINMAVTATVQEVLDRVREVQEEMEREQEQELVTGLLSELHGGGKAVSGLDAVVDALSRGRVWKLFYAKGTEASGWECRGCGAFTATDQERCPMCGEPLESVKRFVDRLSQAVLDMGGRVEMVDGPAADNLREVDSIAALLRY
jgi:peptide chain release factor subunit 1